MCLAALCGHPATGLGRFCALMGGCICLLAFVCSSYISVLVQAMPWLMPFCGGVYPPFPSVCHPIYLLVLLSASGFCPFVRINGKFCFLFNIFLDSVPSAIWRYCFVNPRWSLLWAQCYFSKIFAKVLIRLRWSCNLSVFPPLFLRRQASSSQSPDASECFRALLNFTKSMFGLSSWFSAVSSENFFFFFTSFSLGAFWVPAKRCPSTSSTCLVDQLLAMQ
jgi:hypothetical protein